MTHDQVLEIRQRAEDNGFVQITNIDGENNLLPLQPQCIVCVRDPQLFNTLIIFRATLGQGGRQQAGIPQAAVEYRSRRVR